MPASFNGAIAKLTIASLDDTDLEVVAHYNPKDLEVGRNVSWNPRSTQQKILNGRAVADNHLEIGNVESRTMTLEMLFDCVETGESVEPLIDDLDTMAASRDTESQDEDMRRPHQCVVIWGDNGRRPMPCVIESLTVKYTMFSRTGVPLRAMATVKVREALVLGDRDIRDAARSYCYHSR